MTARRRAANLATESWVFWGAWAGVGLAYELFAVYNENRLSTLPLTRVVRDRLMRRHIVAKFGMLTFLTWLWIHFVFPRPGKPGERPLEW